MKKNNKNLFRYALGIDVGTTNAKVGLLNLHDLKLESTEQRPYSKSRQCSSSHIWEKSKEAIDSLLEKTRSYDLIGAIGISGQMHGCVFYDRKGKPFDEIINWQDKRADEPLRRYSGKTTIDVINEIASKIDMDALGIDRIPGGYMASTLFYLKENEKDFFERIGHVSFPSDFIRSNITGFADFKTDRTNAASSGMFDVKKKVWHEDLLKVLGLPADILPEVICASDMSGPSSKDFNSMLRLKKSIPVIVGGGDNQLSIYGSGIDFLDTETLLNMGTGSQISKVSKVFKKIKGLETRIYIDDRYILVGASLGGGTSYSELQKELKISYKQMDELAQEQEPGALGLRYSTGPTRLDPGRKKGFYSSKNTERTKGLLCRAVMEGVLMDLLIHYNKMGPEKGKLILASGGGFVNSSIWTKIASDMFGKPIRVMTSDSTIIGSALLAARSAGADIEGAEFFDNKKYRDFNPDKKNMQSYKKIGMGN
jgi:xylulokinase